MAWRVQDVHLRGHKSAMAVTEQAEIDHLTSPEAANRGPRNSTGELERLS